jgi:hypothetical protein
MAGTLSERNESRSYGSDGSATLVYNWRGAGSDAAAAYTALLAALPATFDGKTRETAPQMDPVVIDTVGGTGDYLVTCRYMPVTSQPQAAAEITVRIATQSRNQHITQAYAHVASYPASPTPPDHKGAIGVTKDGVDGCDVDDPEIAITVMRRYTLTTLPATATLMALRGKVNSDTVSIKDTRKNRTWSLAGGELRCTGVEEGLLAADGLVDVAFQFVASENKTGLTIGTITDVAKKGHEYLWVEYLDSIDAGGRKICTPLYAHVEQVYPTTAMSGLGLGGT